jgi:uncharacterized membrane protein
MAQPPYPPPYPPSTPPPGGQDPDVQANKVYAVLAYLGILVLVPIFGAKESRFARYHANQGLILLIAEIAYGVVAMILSVILSAILVTGPGGFGIYTLLMGLIGLLSLAFAALAIIGIVNAAQGNYKPLPIIGKYTLLK